LRIDGQDGVASRRQDAPHLVDRSPVPVVVHDRMLEQAVAIAKLLKLLRTQEVVMNLVELPLAPLAGGGRDDRHDLRMTPRQLGHDGAFANA
jgi:hypothetical protein